MVPRHADGLSASRCRTRAGWPTKEQVPPRPDTPKLIAIHLAKKARALPRSGLSGGRGKPPPSTCARASGVGTAGPRARHARHAHGHVPTDRKRLRCSSEYYSKSPGSVEEERRSKTFERSRALVHINMVQHLVHRAKLTNESKAAIRRHYHLGAHSYS